VYAVLSRLWTEEQHNFGSKSLTFRLNMPQRPYLQQSLYLAFRGSGSVSGKLIDVADVSAVVDSALDAWFTTGRFAEEFERKLARFVGVPVRIARVIPAPPLTSWL